MQPFEAIAGCSGSTFMLSIPNAPTVVMDPFLITNPPIAYKEDNLQQNSKTGENKTSLNRDAKWYGYIDVPILHKDIG